jgi:tetratricopeptide (TPR) repeat protein
MGGQLGLSLSLQSCIEKELELQQLSLQELAHRTGVNRGILSTFFTSNPPKALSIKQLDMIIKGLQKQEGWLYDLYAKECFSEKVHWKQLKPFLLRCVDLNRNDLIENILSLLMESLVHIPDVFALAESLYSEGKWRESLPFYRCVCENEIKQHSIRMAMSQYRFFRTRLGSDLKENHEAAIQFAPYRQRLPENVQLDALLQLANVHFTLQNWEEVISYANELQNLVGVILKQKNISTRKSKNTELLITDRHLVFYYGQAYLLQGNAYEWMGKYEKSMQFIP